MGMFSPEGSQRLFQQIMSIWILPEIQRRKEKGILPENFQLTGAQVLFSLDESCNRIRLNDEVRAIAEIKLKKDIGKSKGEPVFEHEIESIEGMKLAQEDDPNIAHITLARLRDEWCIFFDFRYNKGKASERYSVAQEFYEAAELCYKNQLWRPFVDALFSATELLASCQLLLMPDREYANKQTHRGTQIRYNKLIGMGNYKVDYKDTLNKLSGLRDVARYLKGSFKLSNEEAEKFMTVTREMLEFTKKLLR